MTVYQWENSYFTIISDALKVIRQILDLVYI